MTTRIGKMAFSHVNSPVHTKFWVDIDIDPGYHPVVLKVDFH